MDILCGVNSGLILKKFTYHKDNVNSILISPTNNNIFFVETIVLNARVWDIHSIKFVKNHVGHEYDTNSVFFLPMEMPLAFDQMTPPVF